MSDIKRADIPSRVSLRATDGILLLGALRFRLATLAICVDRRDPTTDQTFVRLNRGPAASRSLCKEQSIRTVLIARRTMDQMDADMWWTVLKEAATKWSSHKDARQGAALAYYSVFSLGPIIVIAIAVAGLLFGHDAVTEQVMSSIKDMLGETGAKAIEAMLVEAAGLLRAFSPPYLV